MTSAPEPVAGTPAAPPEARESLPATTTGDGATEGGLLEWVLQRRTMARAREAIRGGGARRHELYRRAQLALELAHRTHDGVDPLRAGPATPLATGLYREAIHWALASLAAAPGGTSSTASSTASAPRASLAELWDTTDLAAIDAALPGSVARVRQLAVERSFVDDAEENESVQTADATVLREFTTALVARAGGAEQRLERLEKRRMLRGLGAFLTLMVIAFVVFSGVSVALRKPDLAKGKPWRASSSWGECTPSKRTCGAIADTGIFFHTNEDASPWVEIDLGKPTAFSSLTVVNRADCCGERALPLVVEVGSDQKTWTEVARRTAEFTTWKASFPAQNARYVRLRADRKTWLHLEKVAVHP